MLAKLGKPARGMGGVRCREVKVDVLAPCAIVALLRNEPVAGANRRVDCALVAGMTMPGDEPAHDLRGVEHRWPCGILGHFAARERTIWQLKSQEEPDGAGGTFFKTRECRLLREIEERRDEVSCRLGIGRRPRAAEAEPSGHASVACRVLRAGKPAGSGQQVIFISVAGGGIALPCEDIADQNARACRIPTSRISNEASEAPQRSAHRCGPSRALNACFRASDPAKRSSGNARRATIWL